MTDLNQPAQGTAGMTCPKCAGQMRTYERNGVTVDQCADCRGIFLDRGELERLIDAETIHDGGSGGRREPAGSRDERDGEQGDPAEHGSRDGGHRKRRGGFLGDLLDFG